MSETESSLQTAHLVMVSLRHRSGHHQNPASLTLESPDNTSSTIGYRCPFLSSVVVFYVLSYAHEEGFTT